MVSKAESQSTMIPHLFIRLALVPFSAAASACPHAERPPSAFDRPYAGELREYPLPLSEIPRACAEVSGQLANISGCGYEVVVQGTGERFGLIVYPEGCAEIRRHEIGHVNGWSHR